MEQTRRDFLKIAALLSGAAGVSGFLPDSIQRAAAIEPEPGSTFLDAEHIVILMQENRSFDHALGTLQGVRGFNDPRAIRQANGNSVFVQTDAAGESYAPWRLDIRDTKITWMGSIPHSRESQVDAWNEGRYDGWIDAKRSRHSAEYSAIPITMGHYTREDLPFYYELADAFTVCDQTYCGVMSSTTPNRCTFWTGTVRDKQSRDSLVHMRNEEIDIGGKTWKTYPERLQEAGIPWKYYQNELWNCDLDNEGRAWLSNFGLNVLEFFGAYNVEAYPEAAEYMRGRIVGLNKRIEAAQRKLATTKNPQTAQQMRQTITVAQRFIGKLNGWIADGGAARYAKMTAQERKLYDAAFVTNTGDPDYRALTPISFEAEGKQQQMMVPKGDILYQFRKDVDEGKLPAISWLGAPENFSDHPVAPWYGAWYVSEVMDILTKNPEVWKKTIFILTYDENDGYFDHCASFVAADPKRPSTGGASKGIDTGIEYTYAEDELVWGVPYKEARSGPIGMGYRIPTIVASPWSRGGWVNSQLHDHTSTLMFLEEFVQKKFGKRVRQEEISAWRRAVAGNLIASFRPQGEDEPKLDYLNRDKFVVGIQKARYKELPSNYKQLTKAEIKDINENLLHSPATSHQEPGIRPACALPYELYAEGGLSADRSKFVLHLTAGDKAHGKRSAGAPFNVYLFTKKNGGQPEMTAATYAVRAGDTLHEEFPMSLFDAEYSIDVHGPNGFFRSFQGPANEPAVQVTAAYERAGSGLTGNVEVKLRNEGAKEATVEVRDNSYKTGHVSRTVAAGQEASVVLPLEKSHGWYDFTVQAVGSKTWARFAGRVETGRSSFSDPLMGGVV